jgi:peptide/nickel transport system substrate-binding protein
MKKNLMKGLALVSASVLGVTGLSLAPANASASNKTVIVQESNALSGLNTAVNGKNLLTNSNVVNPTGAGFYYFNNKATLVRNTAFGTYKITKNTCTAPATAEKSVLDAQYGCFKVTYTIKKGLKYSDGTLITAQDLLLSHAISSSDYSIKAGLGDPASDAGAKFDSAGYGGAYDEHTRADSFDLSDDNFSVTVAYDAFMPDWQVFGPGPGAVHAIVGLAKGKKVLGTARVNASYKSVFEDAYYGAYATLPAANDPDYDDELSARNDARALMTKIAAKWSTAWNITEVSSATNPLLLISNGPMMLESCTSSACSLKKNPYAALSGSPKVTGNLEHLIFKFTSGTLDDTSVAQAIKAGSVDMYSGGATSSFWSIASTAPGVTTNKGVILTYEHLDLRSGDSQFPMGTASSPYTITIGGSTYNCDAPYTGPFAGNSQKAKDLRKAFMLVVPRQTIANTYVGKVFDPAFTGTSPTLDSLLSVTSEGDYAKVAAGSSAYLADFKKDQATRVALALALVKKYYPSAGPGSNSITVRHLTSSRPLRVDNAGVITTEAAKAGIKVEHSVRSKWSAELDCNYFDSAEFAWVMTGLSQTRSNANYESDGGNNSAGWNDPTMDTLFSQFEKEQTATSLITTKINAEKQLWSNYFSLPLYQWPGAAAWNSDIKNVLPNPLAPEVTWNSWALSY